MAIELLDHLAKTHDGTPLKTFAVKLSEEIEADRKELKDLMRRLDISESTARKASAWVAGKVTELKLALDDAASGDLRLLESFEFLSLGIEGKRSLWVALAATAENAPALQSLDFERLITRATDQRGLVEELRIAAARKALQP